MYLRLLVNGPYLKHATSESLIFPWTQIHKKKYMEPRTGEVHALLFPKFEGPITRHPMFFYEVVGDGGQTKSSLNSWPLPPFILNHFP